MEHSNRIWWAEGRGGGDERGAAGGEEECSAAGREGRMSGSCERGGLVILRLGPLGPKYIGDTGHSKRISYAQNTMQKKMYGAA